MVIGSGFGGSVGALRLAQKGYDVAVLEAGGRFSDDELPRSTWQMSRCFWRPFDRELAYRFESTRRPTKSSRSWPQKTSPSIT